MSSTDFHINSALDVRRIRADFEAHKRVQISNFLHPDDAELLLSFLKGSDSWKLVLNQGEKLFELDRAAQSELQGERERQLELAVYAAARSGFQYRFETIRVPDQDVDRAAESTPLNKFARFLSSDEVLKFLRGITGMEDLRFADAQATAYGPGHFLTAHDDDVVGKQRRAAYVFNLSRDWPVDWGGLLTFPEPGCARAEAFIPSFNTLNLFAVPQLHSVGVVAPFAARRRYSVTGWLRSEQPQ